jgi:hypothetical protein
MTPALPQWLATLILACALIGAAEIAYRIARRALDREDAEHRDPGAGVGVMLSGALALLGLLVGFTFAMASDRFDARRAMVNEEANAIGTAYLRSRLVIGPDRGGLPALWAEYAEARVAASHADDQQVVLAKVAEADGLQTRIWMAVQRETATARDDVTASLIDATNIAFDIAGSRRTAVEARIPPGVIWTIIVYAIVSSALLGHVLALDRRRFIMSSVLLALVAMSIAMILDLDRPQSGLVRVSQAPLDRAVATIRNMQAADRAPGP